MRKKDLDIALWLSLIIAKVADVKRLSRPDAFVFLKSTDALGFLIRNYEVEHLENPLNVLEDIDQFVLSNQ
jgi:hypothetical protein